MKLSIVKYGDPILKAISAEVGPDTPGLDALVSDMLETVDAFNGAGLAAPQVGVSQRLFVIGSGYSLDRVFINPVLTWVSSEKVLLPEGCLSIPFVVDEVRRPASIEVEFSGLDFVRKTVKFHGLEARIIQHEIDHLDGILFPDRLSKAKQIFYNFWNNVHV